MGWVKEGESVAAETEMLEGGVTEEMVTEVNQVVETWAG